MEKQVKVIYRLSQEGQRKSLLAGGDGKQEQVIKTSITPELLEQATIFSDGDARWEVSSIFDSAKIEGVVDFTSYRSDMNDRQYAYHKPRINKTSTTINFDEPQTINSLLAFVRGKEAAMAALVAKLEAQLPDRIALWEKGVTKHKEAVKAVAQAMAEREAREKAEKDRREAEKTEWIATHGSDYLRRALALGYDCQRRYVTERAEHELSGFAVDFDDLAQWKSRSCPSEESLELVEALIKADHDAKCVWLTNSTVKPEWDDDEDDYREGFEPCEAVVIQGYIGKYDLVKII